MTEMQPCQWLNVETDNPRGYRIMISVATQRDHKKQDVLGDSGE